MAALGQQNFKVRPLGLAVLADGRRLGLVFASAAEPGIFQQALQRGFAPVAQGLLVAFQRAGEVVGVLRHLVRAFLQFGDLPQQVGAFAGALGVNPLGADLKIFQVGGQRLDDSVQLFAGGRVKRRAFFVQNFLGQILKLPRHFIAGLAQQLNLFRAGFAFGLQLGLQAGVVLPDARFGIARAAGFPLGVGGALFFLLEPRLQMVGAGFRGDGLLARARFIPPRPQEQQKQKSRRAKGGQQDGNQREFHDVFFRGWGKGGGRIILCLAKICFFGRGGGIIRSCPDCFIVRFRSCARLNAPADNPPPSASPSATTKSRRPAG